MSEIFAVQLTAVATLALAVLALATAFLALLAWLKQSREVRDQAEMLALQAKELRQVSADRKREAGERRRAQAVQVYLVMIPADEGLLARVRNTSQQPVYGLRVEDPVEVPASGTAAEVLMPGGEYGFKYSGGHPPEGERWTPAVTFRDRAGVRWRTWTDGRLEEIPEPPDPAELPRPPTSRPK